jgi:hypothetical protein
MELSHASCRGGSDSFEMPREDEIRDKIQQIAARQKQTRLGEIEWVVNALESYESVSRRKTRHAILFGVGTERFAVCPHNARSQHLKACYVKVFLDAMATLGWFDEE